LRRFETNADGYVHPERGGCLHCVRSIHNSVALVQR
jgi:hypothetical protein